MGKKKRVKDRSFKTALGMHSVINPNGNTRTFEQNLVFLTLFCSLYEREAVKQPM